ncbi:hypothetical protein [Plebeiibacterium marinum]|uniref:Uncharacterized protein n=1 Tax=Plebeiibacterium marinum TaxID=2992111 RepID=A0AAE3MDM9_9BACT|nr:hypothetical protein [Plebeiobacterium marinum]MCW3805873.1 hypothetical protein [Plebeiobacterium marinum]
MNIPDTVIFTTSISIMTFFLGFIIREWIILYSNNNRIRNSNGYIQWNLNRLIESLPKQIDGYIRLVNNIKEEDYRNWYIEPSLKPEIVIQNEELLHKLIFNRKKGNKKDKNRIFNNIVSQCLIVKSILDETNKMFEKINNEILTYEVKLDDTGIKLYQKIMDSNSKSEPNLMDNEVFKIYDDFCRIKIKKRSIVHSELTNKIESLLLNENYPNLIEYLELTSMYQKDFEYYDITLKQFQVKVLEYEIALKASANTLNQNILDYNKMKFRSDWIK